MTIFIDTSAFLALGAVDDPMHTASCEAWAEARRLDATLLTSNYVLVETIALLQRRHGMEVVRQLVATMLGNVATVWVESDAHAAAMRDFCRANRRKLSLVDCVSFEVMRRLGIETAFTFDPHFAEMGFDVVPQPG